MTTRCVFGTLLVSIVAFGADTTITISPDTVSMTPYRPGSTHAASAKCDGRGEQKFTATIAPKLDSTDAREVTWSLNPADASSGNIAKIDKSSACYTVPTAEQGKLPPAGRVTVTATLPAKDASGTAVTGTATVFLEPQMNGGGEFARIIAGFEQSAASSSDPAQKAFIDMYFSRPFPMQRRPTKPNDPVFRAYGSPLRLWGYARFSSVPQQISASVATFDIAKQFGDVKINELVQSVEVLAGVEYRIAADVLGRDLFDLTGKSRTTVSLIAAYGAVTPVNPKQVASIFETPDPASNTYKQFATLYPDAAVLKSPTELKYKAIAFVGRDRDRFYREYYGGLRFETRYFDNGYRRITRPPHTLDIMLGQNETVTRGRTQGLVFRLEFFYALPFEKASFIYLYATGTRRAFTQARETDSLVLQPSNITSPCPSGQTCRSLYSADTFVAPLPASSRDFYRVGIGLDFVQMFKSIKQKAANAAGGTTDPAAQPPAVAPPK